MNPSSSVESLPQSEPSPSIDLEALCSFFGDTDLSEFDEEDLKAFFRKPPTPDHVSSDSSDDEEQWWLLGKTEEEAYKIWEKYWSQVKESGGFDIDEDAYPGGQLAIFIPCPEFREEEEFYDTVKNMAREAAKTFKDDSGKQYELVDVEKVVWTTNRLFYITFIAKQRDAPSDAKPDDVVKTLQAVIFNEFTHYTVQSCRIKPAD